MKTLFAKIKLGFAKVSWVLRRNINRFKTAVKSGLSIIWAKATNKDKRLAKARVKLDYLKDYLEFSDYGLDVRFDVDVNELRSDLKAKRQALKSLDQTHIENIKKTQGESLAEYEQGLIHLQEIDQARLLLATEYEKRFKRTAT